MISLTFKTKLLLLPVLLLVFFIIISTLSCMPYDPNDGNLINDGPQIDTIFWEPDSEGFIQFYTNDSHYLGVDGWTFWKWDNTVTEDPMQYVETEVKKISGAAGMGYGIIFCFTDSDNFFLLVIDTNGEYMIGKICSGSFSTIVDWTASLNLNIGYSVVNTIKVEKTGPRNFTVYFNGQEETTFSDDIVPYFTGGKYGFIVSISAAEDFPDTPVDVRFRQLNP